MEAGAQRIEVTSEAALWDWLAEHHAREEGVWLATPLKASGRGFLRREAVLDALVAHGWVDGRRMAADGCWTLQWISPRRARDWAESYCRRAEDLIDRGRMHPAGLRAVAAAKAAGRWRAWPEVDALDVPDDLARSLAERSASCWFDAAAPSYRRNVLRWIGKARRPETRARRVAAVADAAANGRKVPQF